MMKEESTQFGYQRVDKKEKTRKVAEVFSSVANKYDVMNDLMSCGIHRLWKRYAIAVAGVRSGQHVLDLAGGTGDLTTLLADRVGSRGEVILCDYSEPMLAVGRARLADKGLVGNVRFVQGNAETLPFPDNYFDRITIAFGLRNVTDKMQALQAMLRVLKPGGNALVLEFSKPYKWLKPAYDIYSFGVIPLIGHWIVNDAASYRYLAESIRVHPDQQTLKELMQEAGFERSEYFNLSGGIVAVHKGYKL